MSREESLRYDSRFVLSVVSLGMKYCYKINVISMPCKFRSQGKEGNYESQGGLRLFFNLVRQQNQYHSFYVDF